jgi:hypothetical protein
VLPGGGAAAAAPLAQPDFDMAGDAFFEDEMLPPALDDLDAAAAEAEAAAAAAAGPAGGSPFGTASTPGGGGGDAFDALPPTPASGARGAGAAPGSAGRKKGAAAATAGRAKAAKGRGAATAVVVDVVDGAAVTQVSGDLFRRLLADRSSLMKQVRGPGRCGGTASAGSQRGARREVDKGVSRLGRSCQVLTRRDPSRLQSGAARPATLPAAAASCLAAHLRPPCRPPLQSRSAARAWGAATQPPRRTSSSGSRTLRGGALAPTRLQMRPARPQRRSARPACGSGPRGLHFSPWATARTQ